MVSRWRPAELPLRSSGEGPASAVRARRRRAVRGSTARHPAGRRGVASLVCRRRAHPRRGRGTRRRAGRRARFRHVGRRAGRAVVGARRGVGRRRRRGTAVALAGRRRERRGAPGLGRGPQRLGSRLVRRRPRRRRHLRRRGGGRLVRGGCPDRPADARSDSWRRATCSSLGRGFTVGRRSR
jgi:hypothetical protein